MEKTQGPSEGTLLQFVVTVVRWVFGICLIVLGIVGLALPVLQGIAMIIAGLMLLGKKDWLYKARDLWRGLRRKLSWRKGTL